MAIRKVFELDDTNITHLGATREQCRDGVEFYADFSNTDTIYIGDHAVSAATADIRLEPGERTRVPCKHLANYYAIADVATDVLRVSGE